MKELSQSAKDKAAKIAESIMAQFQATSVQYAILYNDEVLFSGTSGVYDRRGLKAMDKDVLFGVGSVSKMYVTAAVMLLWDQGKLDLEKPFKSYVPDFEMADERYKLITPRMLLNHSSGIYGSHFKNSFLFEDNDSYTQDHLLENLKADSLKYEPGRFSEYCNDGFQLLELLVERVGGMKYNVFLHKNFFEPMGFANTLAPLDNFDRARLARYYTPAFSGAQPVEITNVTGTGGIISTAEEMCRFAQVLTGKKILSEKAADMMAQKEYVKGVWPVDDEENNLFGYGLGWDHVHQPPFDKYDIQALCKGGDTGHYHSSLICLPKHGLAAAALSSGGISILSGILATEMLLAALRENGIIEDEAKTAVPDDLLKYSGLYGENGKFVTIDTKDGVIELPAQLSLIPAQKYTYSGGGLFKGADGKAILRFEERDGRTFLQGDLTLAFPEIGEVKWKAFMYQKLDKNELDGKTAAAWEKRKDKKYLVVDDKFTSPQYMTASPFSVVEVTVDTSMGYAHGGCRIIDENNAKNVLYFRDVCDLSFYVKDGAEYLLTKGSNFIGEDHIPTLDSAADSVTIGDDGFTKYFKADEKSAGKITVILPPNSAFAAYDAQVNYKNLSTVSGDNTAVLEKGDMIAFIGSAGAKFELKR